MSNDSNEEKVFGFFFLFLIVFIGFWYWHCSDGVRAVKNMHAYEIFCFDDLVPGIDLSDPRFSEDNLEKQGYNVDITFEEALERTNPKKIEFEPFAPYNIDLSQIKEFRENNLKIVSVNVTYDPPLDNRYSFINFLILVHKESFYHFNPTVVTPFSITIRGNDTDINVPMQGFNDMHIAKAILRFFHD